MTITILSNPNYRWAVALLLAIPLASGVSGGSLMTFNASYDVFPRPLTPETLDFVTLILDEARSKNIISEEQLKLLTDHASERFESMRLGFYTKPLIEVTEAQQSWLLLNAMFLIGASAATGGLITVIHLTWRKYSSTAVIMAGLICFSIYTFCGRYLAEISSEFVGVLLSVVGLAFVPLTIFGIHQKQTQPRRSIRPSMGDKVMKSPFGRFFKTEKGLRVVIEVFTLAFGAFLLSWNKFAFLIVPLVITAYMLLMDVVSIRSEEDEDWKNLLGTSILFSAAVLIIAYSLDQHTIHDYSFWMYILGSLAFSLATSFYPVPTDPVLAYRHENLYLFAHLTVVCFATAGDRFVLGLVGALSCFNFWLTGIWKSFGEHGKSLSVIYIRLGFALMTLALSIQVPSSLIFWQGVLGLIYFNIVWTQRAHMLGTKSNELAYLTHLITNLGLIYVANKFDYRASLILHSFEARSIVSLCGSAGVLLNFVWAFFLSRKILLVNIRGLYSAYRIYIAVLLIVSSIFFRSYELVVIGVVSILIYLWLVLFFEVPDYRTRSWPVVPSFVLCCLNATVSSWFNFSFGFYISSVFLVYCVRFLFRRPYPRVFFLVLTLSTCLLAALLDSRLLIGFGALGIVAYIADGFRTLIKKKSIMLPVTLFSVGGGMLGLGWIYLRYQGILRDSFIELVLSMLPAATVSLPEKSLVILEQASQRVLDFSLLIVKHSALNTTATEILKKNMTLSDVLAFGAEFLFWPYYVTEIFSSMDPTLMVLLTGIALGAYYSFSYVVDHQMQGEHEDSSRRPPALRDVQMVFNFPRDTNRNGIVLEYSGQKELAFRPDKVWLEIDGDDFWVAIKSLTQLSSEFVRFAKSLGYPILLTPKRFPLPVFKFDNTTVHGFAHIGTGVVTGHAVSQEVIRNTLRKLITYGDKPITFRFLYESEVINGVLFEVSIAPSQILNSVRNSFSLVTELAEIAKQK